MTPLPNTTCSDGEVIECPWCGQQSFDLEELREGPGQIEQCEDCGELVALKLTIRYDYTAEPIGDPPAARDPLRGAP